MSSQLLVASFAGSSILRVLVLGDWNQSFPLVIAFSLLGNFQSLHASLQPPSDGVCRLSREGIRPVFASTSSRTVPSS